MEKINNELPKVIYDELAFADAVDTLVNDITRQSTNAIKILRERFTDEITNDVASLDTFSDISKFKDFINDARTSYIANVTYMPQVEKDRINRMYDDLYDACISSVKDLQRMFALPYHLTYDGTKLVPDKSVIEKAIKKNFLLNLSDKEREYYKLLASAKNALCEIESFEEKNHFEKFCTNGFYSESNMGYYKHIDFYPFLRKLNEQSFLNCAKAKMFEAKY